MQDDATARKNIKMFNTLTTTLLEQMLKIFPADGKLVFMKQELVKNKKDPQTSDVPCKKFVELMCTDSGLTNEAGLPIVVGELIVNRDSRIFSPEVNVPALDFMGIKDKWSHLNEQNKKMVWGYMEHMSKSSAKACVGYAMQQNKELSELIGKIIKPE